MELKKLMTTRECAQWNHPQGSVTDEPVSMDSDEPCSTYDVEEY